MQSAAQKPQFIGVNADSIPIQLENSVSSVGRALARRSRAMSGQRFFQFLKGDGYSSA